MSISLLGTKQQISHSLGKYPPLFPVKPIQFAPSFFANFRAFTIFFDFPLPLKDISRSPFYRKLRSCSTKISSYDTSFDQARVTGMLSTKEIAEKRLLPFVIAVFNKSETR